MGCKDSGDRLCGHDSIWWHPAATSPSQMRDQRDFCFLFFRRATEHLWLKQAAPLQHLLSHIQIQSVFCSLEYKQHPQPQWHQAHAWSSPVLEEQNPCWTNILIFSGTFPLSYIWSISSISKAETIIFLPRKVVADPPLEVFQTSLDGP